MKANCGDSSAVEAESVCDRAVKYYVKWCKKNIADQDEKVFVANTLQREIYNDVLEIKKFEEWYLWTARTGALSE